jgi:hypothetical protein
MSLPPVCFADLFLRIFFFDDRYGDSMLLVARKMVFQFVTGQRVSDGKRDRYQGATSVRKSARNIETGIRTRLQSAKARAILRRVSGHDF